jgi:hypothetical protein
MNFAVVLGQLCLDRKFREEFFGNRGENAKAVLDRYLRLPFTWAEEEFLLEIAKHGGNSPGLKQDFEKLNENLEAAAGCPRGPCPIHYFTVTPQPTK